MDVSEDELQSLYTWVDDIPLSRPKRNIARDFSDGVLVAEVVAHYFPKLVQLHNYSSANSLQQKMYNWNTLNQKVFRRLGFQLDKQECQDIANAAPGSVERALKLVKQKISSYVEDASTSPPGALQGSPIAHHSMATGESTKRSNASTLQVFGGIVHGEVLAEKEQIAAELKEANEILETKVRKLEQLVKLKDAKIQTLMAKLQAAGLL